MSVRTRPLKQTPAAADIFLRLHHIRCDVPITALWRVCSLVRDRRPTLQKKSTRTKELSANVGILARGYVEDLDGDQQLNSPKLPHEEIFLPKDLPIRKLPLSFPSLPSISHSRQIIFCSQTILICNSCKSFVTVKKISAARCSSTRPTPALH